MNFPIVAYHIGHHYEVCAGRLRSDCEKLGYQYDIHTPDDIQEFISKKLPGVNLRDWICRYKPKFISDMLKKYEAVLYLDVDAHVNREIPVEIFKDVKMGICSQYYDSPLFDILTACIFFRRDPVIEQFLQLWYFKGLTIPIQETDHWFLKTTVLDMMKMKSLRMDYVDKSIVLAAYRGAKNPDPIIWVNARKFTRR